MKNRTTRATALLVSMLFALGGSTALAEKPSPGKEGEKCGTNQGISCAEGLVCDLREGACDGRDLDGVCVKTADKCTEENAPVCGCNGKTYSSDYKRIKAKVQKNHAGDCKANKNQTRPAGGK